MKNKLLAKSIVIQYFPQQMICQYPDELPAHRIAIDGGASRFPNCAAPWSTSADILSTASKEFIGFTYPVDDSSEYAQQLVQQTNSENVRYICRESSYADGIYKEQGRDCLEILISSKKPEVVIKALSLDGFWYLDEEKSRLLAFGISNIDDLLEEHGLRLSKLLDLPTFTPTWIQK